MLDVWLKTGSMFLLIAIGALLRRRGMMDERMTRQLAGMLTRVFYPALIFSSMVRKFTWEEILARWPLPAGAALIMVVGWLTGTMALRAWRSGEPRFRRTFLFQSVMNNYSFLPMLLAYLFWGELGMARVVYSTLGAELVVWTLGIWTLSGQGFSRKALRHLLNMPLLAMAGAGLVLAGLTLLPAAYATSPGFPGKLGDTLVETLRLLGGATIPISALIAGSRMAGLHPRHFVTPPALVIVALRLALIPALALAAMTALPFGPVARPVLMIIAVMPCAITSVTLCEVYNADSEFAAATVLITHIVALATIPAWLGLLGLG